MHQKITVLTSSSISVAASDSESYTISANWKTSDLHIDLASEVSTNSLILNSELVLLLLEWQRVISVGTLPGAFSVNVIMSQSKLIVSVRMQ